MANKNLKQGAPARGVTDVGAGDYVKVGQRWERITENRTQGASHAPRSWTVQTERGVRGMFEVGRYAKAEDLE